MNDEPVERLLQRLSGVTRRGDQWQACCPAHDDRHASLGVTVGSVNQAVLHCHAGCPPEAVVAAIGWEMRDLFPEQGLSRREVAAYDYRDETGELLYQTVRFEPKGFKQRRPGAFGTWEWKLGDTRRVLYCLGEVLRAAQAGERVYLCEGEKDADNVARLGLAATTNVGGAKKWRPEYTEVLRGASVVLLPDNDPAGREHVERAAASLREAAASVRVLELPGLGKKDDASDWIARGGTRAELEALAEETAEWEPGNYAAAAQPGADGTSAGRIRFERNFDIERIEKVDSRPPTYYVHTLGGVVAMTSAELGNFGPFSLKVMEALNRVPDMRNPLLNWRAYLDDCMVARLEIIEAPDDASPEAMIWHQVRVYLEKQANEDESALAELRGVFSNERFLYFHGPTLHRWLNTRNVRVEPAQLWDVLRRQGAASKPKKVRDKQGVSRLVRAWTIPKERVTPVTPAKGEDVTE